MTYRSDYLASGLVAITPSDTAFVDLVGLLISATSGTVTVVDSLGNTTTYTSGGPVTIWARIVQVKATGTTIAAANLVGLKA